MRPVPFTQYMLPRGERRDTSINMPDDVAALADVVLRSGYRFEVELLRVGLVSQTCTGPMLADPSETCDIAIEVTPNGPEVLEATERLIRESHRLIAEAGMLRP